MSYHDITTCHDVISIYHGSTNLQYCFLYLASIIRDSSSNLPSTVSVHNLNHMIYLLCCCCHANTNHYLQVAKAMMDQVAPSIVPDHVPWPTREHFKYYMETWEAPWLFITFDCGILSSNLSIKRHFDENPILWSLLQLLAEGLVMSYLTSTLLFGINSKILKFKFYLKYFLNCIQKVPQLLFLC